MFIRFTDADRERFGLQQEWVELDREYLTVAEAEALEKAGGAWTTLDDEGVKPTRCRLWLALYRAGVRCTLADLDDINLGGTRSRLGKDPEPSPPSDAPTPPTSASSRRTRRSKSQPST